ncbi:MAG: hypothetical protein ACK4SO_07620, partial [Candidatus Kapaibacteriota bacterium]
MMRLNRFLNQILAIVFFAALYSCNELPTEITYSLLYDTTVVSAISSDTVEFFSGGQSKFVFAQIFNTGAIFLGGWNGYRAASLLRFKESNLPDTLLWLTEERIDSVHLVLPFSNYALGDTINSTISFKVFLIKDYWTNKVTWDSIFTDWNPNNKIEPMPLGSFYGNIKLTDSIKELAIPLKKGFILDWLQKSKDSIPIWGLLIAPEPNCNSIHQISAQYVTESKVLHPKLVVNYKYLDGSDRIWYIHSAIDASVVDVPKFDTLRSLVVQSGYSYRVALGFDVSKLPPLSAIHYAQLELTIDLENTIYGSSGLDTIFSGGYFGNS